MSLTINYVVITPVRDEEHHIEKTIHSMASQRLLPQEWIVVDDGSTDRTGAILDKYSKKYAWLRVFHRENRGYRKSGGGVVEAFYYGLSKLTTSNWDYIIKLDGDLSFSPGYFERCFSHFKAEPRLGIGGGDIYNDIDISCQGSHKDISESLLGCLGWPY